MALLVSASAWAAEKATDITIDAGNYLNNSVILGYYYNGKMLVKDSLMTDAKGVARIQQDEKLPEGIYVVYFPDKTYFDVMIGADQTFRLTCDTTSADLIKRVKIDGSKSLSEFIDYQIYLSEMHGKMNALQEQFTALPADDEDGKAKIRQEFSALETVVKARNEEIIGKYRGTDDDFLAVFLTALKDVDVPTFESESDSARQAKRYYYYRDHYFDNIDVTDARLLRTPFITQKIDKFINDVVLQHPDTVAEQAIKLIEKTRPTKEAFQFYVSHIYNLFNNSKIMGMDAALVAIADKYYLSGEADWTEEKFINDLRETIDELRYTLINHTAPDLNMISPTGEWFRLSEVDAPFTILVFWEPSCGHCKKEIPLLKTNVYDKFAADGVKVFAVYCQIEKKEWEDFIAEHQLEEWMNVYDPYGRSNYRKFYHIKSTPQIYVLDRDKKIIAKKIGVEQIPDFLNFMMGRTEGAQK